ncbi:MAG: Mur ligase domain-containing protein [Faecalibacterium sp.]
MFMYTDYTQHLLDNVKKIHFIGCGGSGMYPLIQILSAKGYDISGSDVLDGSIIRSERRWASRSRWATALIMSSVQTWWSTLPPSQRTMWS